RHEPTFTASAESTAENTWSGVDLVTHYQNSAYARAGELGGGKAVFNGGFVSAYEASVSIISKNDCQHYCIVAWASNTWGLEALLDADHYWDETDGVIRAVLVMSLDGALSYPADLSDIEGERVALEVGETFAFDVKSNATAADGGVEYFWSADAN